MTRDPLIRASALLCALSLAGGAVTRLPDHRALAPAILGLALWKARLILHRYLGLAAAPRWRQGFDLTAAGFCLMLAVLAVLG
ncbi:MAG: nitric oxide reductase F protein [Gemmobacter sp.]